MMKIALRIILTEYLNLQNDSPCTKSETHANHEFGRRQRPRSETDLTVIRYREDDNSLECQERTSKERDEVNPH